jgi:hypothetical protein
VGYGGHLGGASDREEYGVCVCVMKLPSGIFTSIHLLAAVVFDSGWKHWG